jgi:putative hydrolase of the HAD superfamily
MQTLNWNPVKLVVFDVDGTLYDQKRLRLKMARDLLLNALGSFSARSVRVLSAYRKLREHMGEQEVHDFDRLLLAQTAAQCGVAVDTVAVIVAEWMERRPLPYLPACRFDGLEQLFGRLRAAGKTIGILSDYPAQAKMDAFGLAADIIVCAGDAAVGVLKPHPRGLQHVMELAGVDAGATVMIGDRAERDGDAARRAGAHALIKSSQPIDGWHTFASYHDPIFSGAL